MYGFPVSDVNPPVNLSGPALSKIYVVPEGAIAIAGSPEKGIGKFIVSFPLDEILFNPHCLLMANCDDPYGRVCPTYIISFITLDASCPW